MKRLITVILVLAMLLPALACADESQIIGFWVHEVMMDFAGPYIFCFTFAEGGVCYCLFQVYDKDKPGYGLADVGTWILNDDGTVSVAIKDDRHFTLAFSDDYTIATDLKTKRKFINLSAANYE